MTVIGITIGAMSLGDVAGLVGAGLMLASYAGVQAGRLDPHRPRALLMNLAGAGLVLASLVETFNLASFLLEAAWGLIALAGLVRWLTRRRGEPTVSTRR
jgi:hypothetical protein